ncbi:hypothetical protein [Plasticicumulans acidivorans]|uniref:Uncharacterized protein n=1 Tax=Plasticicumulans acidivorans TaxID=886464 RepID=A0A317MYH0_9GAMM|nr:hypothetical protein [Plasticicumulans acidivorans]PWV64665.1 hypothetical protein C7443_102316 [Plasticicumulans acidivorans]
MHWESHSYYWAVPASSAGLLFALVSVLVNALVIRLAAGFVPSARASYGWCIIAALLTEFMANIGQALLPGGLGALLAIALVALAYHLTLRTSIVGSFGMMLAVVGVRWLLLFLFASFGLLAAHG